MNCAKYLVYLFFIFSTNIWSNDEISCESCRNESVSAVESLGDNWRLIDQLIDSNPPPFALLRCESEKFKMEEKFDARTGEFLWEIQIKSQPSVGITDFLTPDAVKNRSHLVKFLVSKWDTDSLIWKGALIDTIDLNQFILKTNKSQNSLYQSIKLELTHKTSSGEIREELDCDLIPDNSERPLSSDLEFSLKFKHIVSVIQSTKNRGNITVVSLKEGASIDFIQLRESARKLVIEFAADNNQQFPGTIKDRDLYRMLMSPLTMDQDGLKDFSYWQGRLAARSDLEIPNEFDENEYLKGISDEADHWKFLKEQAFQIGEALPTHQGPYFGYSPELNFYFSEGQKKSRLRFQLENNTYNWKPGIKDPQFESDGLKYSGSKKRWKEFKEVLKAKYWLEVLVNEVAENSDVTVASDRLLVLAQKTWVLEALAEAAIHSEQANTALTALFKKSASFNEEKWEELKESRRQLSNAHSQYKVNMLAQLGAKRDSNGEWVIDQKTVGSLDAHQKTQLALLLGPQHTLSEEQRVQSTKETTELFEKAYVSAIDIFTTELEEVFEVSEVKLLGLVNNGNFQFKPKDEKRFQKLKEKWLDELQRHENQFEGVKFNWNQLWNDTLYAYTDAVSRSNVDGPTKAWGHAMRELRVRMPGTGHIISALNEPFRWLIGIAAEPFWAVKDVVDYLQERYRLEG